MFKWTTSPDVVFVEGMQRYRETTMDALFALMEQEAVRCERWMRDNAVWHDDCMPGREYLKAVAFRDDAALQVGIRAYYDHELYMSKCRQKPFPFGIMHELWTFPQAGVISIIVPRRNPSVLGEFAAEVWDKVRALYT
jgi:hypothetical protein